MAEITQTETQEQEQEQEHTIISFNVSGMNENELFLQTFKYLVVEKNKADIVLLQEVKIDNESTFKQTITKDLGKNWIFYTTFNYLSHNNLYNVILIKEDVFGDVKDIHDIWHNQYDILDNNVQALIISKKEGKELGTDFVVVNACANSRKYFHKLKRFIKDLGFYRPLILGGDLELSLQQLLEKKANDKSSYNWYIDGTIDEFTYKKDISINNPHGLWPWTTDVERVFDCDHFIFNEKFKKHIIEQPVILYNYHNEKHKYSMQHGFESNPNKGEVTIAKDSPIKLSKYKKEISTHLPICLTFKI